MSTDDDPSTPLLDDQHADDSNGITVQEKIKITEALLPCSTTRQNGGRGSASTSIDTVQTTSCQEEICIYHVPEKIRRVNSHAYDPQVICIGPIHQEKEVEFMKKLKGAYFDQFLNRLPEEKRAVLQQGLESTIKDCVDEIRKCYADDFSLDEKPFLKMIKCDAVFILELFLKTGEYERDGNKSQDGNKYDYIIGNPWRENAVQLDLILLENQLPFFILDKLYKIATIHIKPAGCCCFLELACQYFKKYGKKETNPHKILHFTDLVRFFLSSGHPCADSSTQNTCCKRATRLEEAGMKFKPMEDACLLDIKAWSGGQEREGIKEGELHIPILEIDEYTECLLRNLMALEQCHFPNEAYICQYANFLDSLVDNDKDADLLIESKVIINRLGESAAVAKLINNLCRNIIVITNEVPSCYNSLAKELNDYSDIWYNQIKAYLRRHFFRNVVAGTATVVGLIVLIIKIVKFSRSF
ncbi:UPF0481 protein At3g47200-like [Populus alba]|uniref:Uncharacterized protein n=1 Tax=Populus alba x Populus x berolinensis TaxID=444605 RepID=A0AAD6M0M1_9ROSI|nr:UPF0481 protein At3g47200-like [Populus alba]KAJ6976744.1 hypothetical protein NC653_028803 [Populus alba x Populus x berolinensis]